MEYNKVAVVTEGQIERLFTRAVERAGGLSIKFTSPSRRGAPDRICILPGGRVLFAELKREGGRVSAAQKNMIRRMRGLGASAWVVSGMGDLEQFAREVLGVGL